MEKYFKGEKNKHLTLNQYSEILETELEYLKFNQKKLNINDDFYIKKIMFYEKFYNLLHILEKNREFNTLNVLNEFMDKYSIGDPTRDGFGIILNFPTNVVKSINKIYSRQTQIDRAFKKYER